jgi:tRNA(adenine34) deaminase
MWTGDDFYFMNIALDEAYRADIKDEVPIGAVVVSEGAMLGRGHNCPVASDDPTAHAEIKALRSAGAWLKNYRMPPNTTIYVTLEPCLMCIGALVHARIDRVVFGAADPKVGATSHLGLLSDARLNHSIEFMGGLMECECREMLQGFFQRKRLSGG